MQPTFDSTIANNEKLLNVIWQDSQGYCEETILKVI